MKLDYENYTIYFTEEELSLFDLKKSVKIAQCKTDCFEAFVCFSQKKGSLPVYIKEDSTIILENNNINITSVYSITDFNFFQLVINNYINQLKYKKNIDTYKIEIELPETLSNIETNLNYEHLVLITNISSGNNYSRKINVVLPWYNSYKIPNKYLPLTYLKQIQYPLIASNNSFIKNLRVEYSSLKTNPLFIAIEIDNKNVNYNDQLSIVKSIRLLSIHRYREYYYTGNTKLLTNPLENLYKVFSKMFLNPINVVETINKILNIEKLNSFEIVSDKKIVDYYLENNYYDKGKGDLGSSCMRHNNCTDKIQFYVDEPNISLLVLRINDQVLGRAVLWTTVSGEIIMDRIYASYESLNKLFIEYAEKNNIKFLYNYKERISNTTGYSPNNFRQKLKQNFKVKLSDETLKRLSLEFKNPTEIKGTGYITVPYLDNFCYLDTINGYLATNASYENEPNIAYCVSKNKYYNIEDLYWFEPDEEYYLKSDIIVTDLGENLPKSKCLHYYGVYYNHENCVETIKNGLKPIKLCTKIINISTNRSYYILNVYLDEFLRINPSYITHSSFLQEKTTV